VQVQRCLARNGKFNDITAGTHRPSGVMPRGLSHGPWHSSVAAGQAESGARLQHQCGGTGWGS